MKSPPGKVEEHKKKKRKLTNDLKTFTSTSAVEAASASSQPKFKGWSDEGHKFMVEKSNEISDDNDRYLRFDAAFRILAKSEKSKKKVNTERYEVDRTAVRYFDT